MFFYPCAVPQPSELVWGGDTVGVALMVVGLGAVTLFAVGIWVAAHRRVVRAVPMLSILPGHPQLPRAAA